MSQLPTLLEKKALENLTARLEEQAAVKARLLESNKQKAREALLLIQLQLAQRPLHK